MRAAFAAFFAAAGFFAAALTGVLHAGSAPAAPRPIDLGRDAQQALAPRQAARGSQRAQVLQHVEASRASSYRDRRRGPR